MTQVLQYFSIPSIDLVEGQKTATKQKYCEAVFLPKRESGFYEGFLPRNEGDIAEIKREFEILLLSDKYKNF